MSSASLRRSITSSDPRSPLQLSSLVTSFPQHQIITSFQTFQVSPLRYSPRRVNQSPVYARPARTSVQDNATSPSRLVKRRRSSSFAKLLAPRAAPAVPAMCACGDGRRSIKHLARDCPKFEAERDRLLSRNPESRSQLPRSTVEITAPQPPQPQNLVKAVRRRTRTLLGKYNIVDVQKEKDEKRPALTAVI